MEQVNFKVKDEEREKLKNDAYAHRMNISEYLRWLIDKQRKEDERKMKTGIMRRVDYLGRIAIPKEIRQKLSIKEGGLLELSIDGNKVIMQCLVGHSTEKGGEE